MKTQQSQAKNEFINRDATGNVMRFIKYSNGNSRVMLELVSEKRDRAIGAIVLEEETIYVARKRGKHLHLKSMSYGLNDFILRNPPVPLKYVVLTDDEASYRIPVQIIFEVGKHLFFKQTGFEKQIFISLDELKKYEI